MRGRGEGNGEGRQGKDICERRGGEGMGCHEGKGKGYGGVVRV